MIITDKFVPRTQLPLPSDQDSCFLDRITSAARVLIIEGISGSGKDTLQIYLKKKLEGRDVYDYSEGELLQSWNQLQIRGIFDLRVKFLKLFVDYANDVVRREKNAVFLLNRFHLSAYAMTVVKEPTLEKEYDEIINVLRTLPVHVFILKLDENEIEKRSLHPERSSAWQKLQQQIVKKEGFRDRVERYMWQQRLLLETAETQQLPYSVIKLASTPETGLIRIFETQSIFHRNVQMTPAAAKMSKRKGTLPETV
jgi:thymidylate kinase